MLNSGTRTDRRLLVTLEFAKVLFFVYCFLVSIHLMGVSFKSSGTFVQSFIRATGNPFIGLIIGIVITSVIQSSSTTTSIIVAMVGAGTLSLQNAIPMVMGANIGTTVTNTIVSFGYAGRRAEFERSFSGAIIHDIFNIMATCILFPLELYTGVIYRSAGALERVFEGLGGFRFVSPLKFIIDPVANPIAGLIGNHILLLVVALAILFFSMRQIVENMKGIVMERVEQVLNKYLFRNALISLAFGLAFTAFVQSSSITTSLIVPLVGAGLITVEQVFPYTLGANIGTTVTALMAALTFGQGAAMSVAIAHLLFNIFGITIIYPVRKIPIWTAKAIAAFVSKSKKHFLVFLMVYILLHLVPILFTLF